MSCDLKLSACFEVDDIPICCKRCALDHDVEPIISDCGG